MKNRKREICTSGSVRDEDGQPPHLLGCARTNPEKGDERCDLKPFVAIQRVQLPPGKGEPASRKRALQGWWQHDS
jgi:hypothetical protein